MNKIPRIGIGVIVLKEHHVLLGLRKGAHGEGDWAFPGGHLEFGETPKLCAARELLEETGLVAEKIIQGPWTNNFFDEDRHYITLFMLVTHFKGNLQVLEPHKCEAWEWFEFSNLPKPLFASIESLILEHSDFFKTIFRS